MPSSATPWRVSQRASSTCATTGQPNRWWIATVSPRWSPWPCVRTMRSQRSGSSSDSGQLGLPFRKGRRRSRFAAGRVDAEGRVPEPGEFGRHGWKSRTEGTRPRRHAASRIGWTTKKEPTVTTTQAAIAMPSAESRGGEPPAGARRSSAPGAHVHPAHDVEVVAERDGRRGDADEHEPPLARVVRGREDEQLPEQPARQREAGHAEHERPQRDPVVRALPAEAGERLEASPGACSSRSRAATTANAPTDIAE